MNLTPQLRDLLEWRPYWDVWVTVAVLAVGYAWAIRRLGPTRVGPGQPVVTRRQMWQWYLGVGSLWVVSDWPFAAIAEGSMFSGHMIEHMVIFLVTAPLLLMGLPGWLVRLLVVDTGLTSVVRTLSRAPVAFVVFTVVFLGAHWPVIVELMITNEWFHFVSHVTLFAAGLIMWMPVLSPLPEAPRLGRPGQMLYLMAHSVIPIVPASFLTFGRTVIYDIYEPFPRLWGWTAVTDQTVAGVILKLGGGFALWIVITVIWFRWVEEQRRLDELEAATEGFGVSESSLL